jgi:hypothetical protein
MSSTGKQPTDPKGRRSYAAATTTAAATAAASGEPAAAGTSAQPGGNPELPAGAWQFFAQQQDRLEADKQRLHEEKKLFTAEKKQHYDGMIAERLRLENDIKAKELRLEAKELRLETERAKVMDAFNSNSKPSARAEFGVCELF